jgi:effector-binding domain-containing protein
MSMAGSGCSLVTVERQHTAVVKTRAALDKLPEAHRAARAKLNAVLSSLDTGTLGRFCTLWHPPADGMLEMEIGIIVARAFAPAGEVVPSNLPAGRAAHAQLTGPFDGLPGAWSMLIAWCAAEGLVLAGVNWEIYGGDPAQPETALYALLT